MSFVHEGKTASLAELRRVEAPESRLPVVKMGFGDLQGFELMQRAAKALAASTLVPQQFQGNLPNCIIALEMANRIGASPLMVVQNLYVVHGRPGWSAKFLIASFNQNGRFTALRYQWEGTKGKDDWGCRAYSTERATGEQIIGPLITIALSKAEGWYEKSGSKWKTIPELMLTYRAAAWLINTHAPEISMGLNTADELGDTFDAARNDAGTFSITQEELRRVDTDTGEVANPQTPGAAAVVDPVKAPIEERIPLEKAIEKLATYQDMELMALYADSLPTDYRQHDGFAKAFRAHMDRLKDNEAAKGRTGKK